MKATIQRSKLTVIFSLIIGLTVAQDIKPLKNLWPVKGEGLLPGFDKVESGSALDFFPFLKKGNVVLYAGENGMYPSIEFLTQKVPADYNAEYATFIFGMGKAKNAPEQSRSTFKMFIGDAVSLDIQSHTDDAPLHWKYQNNGMEIAYVNTAVTKPHGDIFGYLIINVPKGQYTPGKPMKIKVDEVKTNPRDYFMAIQNPVYESFEVATEPAIIRTAEGPKQTVKVDLTYLGKPTKAKFYIDDQLMETLDLNPGPASTYLNVDPVKRQRTSVVKVEILGRNDWIKEIELKPVREFEVYFLPHSHVDIGFTHKQQEVAELQWKNLDLAIDLTEKTADFPDGSQYKWNAEISWVLEGYLEQASEERKQKFINAVKDDRIGVDAFYGSVLTGLQREEEMFYNTIEAVRIAKKYDLDVQSAMISDVPGYTWGTVPTMAQTGIKYFSVGPNHMPQLAHGGYQVGETFETWGDVPMYWKSPSGKEKVLFWMSTHGYSWFHSWSTGNIGNAGGTPILKFLNELETQKYPYDIVQLRYNIGNDNGPPDLDMPDFFREWNEKHIWPRFRIATTLEMMTDFEKRYEDQIPEATGDFTPYWEDGAASSATETSISRNAADKLVQAEALYAMYDPEGFPAEKAYEAWKNVVLFSEHTWGANISKSDPDSEFTKSLWEVKSTFALDADKAADQLIDKIKSKMVEESFLQDQIVDFQVVNTLSWSRSELVKIPTEWPLAGYKVTDENNKVVPSQLLKTGELAFLATDVRAFSSKSYRLKKGKAQAKGSASIVGNKIENDLVAVTINEQTGDIQSIVQKNESREFVDQTDTTGFNAYWYSGKVTENLSRNHTPSISIVESGSVVSSLKVETQGTGSNSVSYTVQITSGSDKIQLINTVDKIKEVKDENVRFSFPFDVPNGEVRLDIPWAVLEPGKNQLAGANNNFFSVQRFVDVSNDSYGITMSTEDAPIWEIGEMYGQRWMTDMENRPWLPDYVPSQRLFSWVMNNIWFVNYKAHQEGMITFRHTLKPHGQFSESDAKKLGMEGATPLLLVPGTSRGLDSFVNMTGSQDVIITSLKPSQDKQATMVRLFNSSKKVSSISLDWAVSPQEVLNSSPLEEKGDQLSNEFRLDPWEIITLRVEK